MAEETRYWLDERDGYQPLSKFSSLSLAIREAESDVWARLHPAEPTVEQRAREIAERRTGMPAYLVDDETFAAATAEAQAEREASRTGGDG